MTNTFKVGDKVTHHDFGAGEITYGPYQSSPGGINRYVMRTDDDGSEKTASGSYLEAVAAFAVGDKVTGRLSGAAYEIVGGPFKGARGTWYATRADGEDVVTSNHEYNLQAVASSDTHTYAGVTYDVPAKYHDVDGDLWKLARVDGVVRARMGSGPVDDGSRRLNSVVDAHGPLTRI